MALPDYSTVGQGGFDVSGSYYRPLYTPGTTSPSYTAGHPFLDPNYTYGGNPDFQNTTLFDMEANQFPQSYYAYLLAKYGLDTTGNQSKLARGLYDRFAQGYAAANLISPELRFTDYMKQQNIPAQVNALSYSNQGIDIGRYQGRDRWGLRGG